MLSCLDIVGVWFVRVSCVILLALMMSVSAPQSRAGTGGIFSSSTSPRRKIQQIQPIESPTSLPGNSVVKPSIIIPATPGTVFFDAKKSGKPDGDLNADKQMHELQQTLSGSSESSSTVNSGNSTSTNETIQKSSDSSEAISKNSSKLNIPEVSLRGLSGSASVTAPQGTGSIDSFFQLDSANVERSNSFRSADTNFASQSNSLRQSSSAESRKSAGVAPLRFLWHVMDNAGVPMFFGNKDNDLDPSLRQGYESSIISQSKALKSNEASAGATVGSASRAPSHGPQKIPESELEGTDSWVKDNEQMP